MGTVKELLAVAVGELGTCESPAGSNRTKYGRWMLLDGQPWCMSFVQWCCAQAGVPLALRTGSCSALLNWYRGNNPKRIVTEPQPGDIIIYTFGHTGILESAAAGTVTAIEGNTSPGSSGSQDNGGGVYRRTRSRSLVRAYIRPDFTEEDDMTGEEIYEKIQDHLSKQPLPDWAKEELAEAVALGITDGKNPMQLVPRYQAAIMAKRAAQK